MFRVINNIPVNKMKNILTIFAGRKANLEILNKYLFKAIEQKIIDEVHYWNYTRNQDDEKYLQSISNIKRVSNKRHDDYIKINTPIKNNSIELKIIARDDVFIKLSDNDNNNYEIKFGGYNKKSSSISRNNTVLFNLKYEDINIIDNDIYTTIKIVTQNGKLLIYKNEELLINVVIEKDFVIEEIFFKTQSGSNAFIDYETTKNHGIFFMDTCEKYPWNNYYNHYDQDVYENDIVLKCDDDIVFIDLNKLPKFIDFVRYNNYDLVFANTINNGVSAYYQQNKYNLIPNSIITLEYPNHNGIPGLEGSLLADGKKAEELHKYFINNYKNFLNYDYQNEIIPIKTRFSINFFGFKCKNWHKIRYCGGDDERNLTIDYVKKKNFNNILYSDFYVSHLSFGGQPKTGMNILELQKIYMDFFKNLNLK